MMAEKRDLFGGSSLHNCMSPHGNDADVFEALV